MATTATRCTVPAGRVVLRHDPTDAERLDQLTARMRQDGWRGRPAANDDIEAAYVLRAIHHEAAALVEQG